MKSIAAALLAAALYAVGANADPVQVCPTDDICWRIAVPSSSASANSGNIYFQLTASDKYQWVALGTGTGMTGANIFLMYQDGKGNMTLSPRSGQGHFMPPVAQNGARLTLLAGSGVSNGQMIANVRCSNCQSWSGGTLQLASSNTKWISAWKQGSPFNTASISQTITVHDNKARLDVNLADAAITSDSNPFVDGRGAPIPAPGSGGGNNNGNGATVDTSSNQPTLLITHGVIMSVVFVILFPLGSILMPVMGKWYVHAAWQMFAFLLMWAGVAIGIIFGRDIGILFQQTHTQLGIAVVCLMAVQPFLGYAHHMHYVRHQRRGLISHAHIWYGRALIIIGIINGGLGIQLANCPLAVKIAYSVVAGVLAIAYVGSAIFGESRRKRRSKNEYSNGSHSSPR